MEHGARESEALLPAAGERAGQQVLLPPEIRHRDRPRLALRSLRAAKTVDASEEPQVLPDGEVLVKTEALAHVSDLALDGIGVLRDIDPQDLRRPGGRREQPAEDPDRGRLPRSIASEESEHLSFFDGDRERVDGREGAEALREEARFDRDRHGLSPTVRRSAARAT